MKTIQEHNPNSRKLKDIMRHYIADIVFGANDGIITTFAIVSGVEGAKLSPAIVVILGFVNLFADGISMGASNYLSIRSDADAKGVSRGYVEPLYHSIATLLAFTICGAIPLISFLLPYFTQHRFIFSCIMTATALFVVGALRIFITGKNWIKSGLEMLLVGGFAACIAYLVGSCLASFLQEL